VLSKGYWSFCICSRGWKTNAEVSRDRLLKLKLTTHWYVCITYLVLKWYLFCMFIMNPIVAIGCQYYGFLNIWTQNREILQIIDHQNHKTCDIVENFQLAAKFKPKVKLAFFKMRERTNFWSYICFVNLKLWHAIFIALKWADDCAPFNFSLIIRAWTE
jgi:hypothetical protein